MTSAARQLTKQVVAETPRAGFATCAYCGRPCFGFACSAHRDLPQLEHSLYTANNAPSRTPDTDARPGASTKGA